ncbi:uncharacterized protein SPAPADRAFT_58161 [Spathaspora passalidarum NRRL Y-27907]|uniref:Tetratricopeptide SHNi-TPR domain-containing protein n=1 Tax=Spathaspora passalidarum (strain NRRL Y-27907 / 11-Y1) TaxID=619300 RepID=G3AFP1_SPAPN|nr:uncharacterized protein SPAPADRAFT_58161 [Spathaspora passalidarum NRRL Y-27907]EGW35030.1 hypothetical protein SPAPADRAFT_58161 [Spathaspora passalidarum NRRL Y-27907]
MALYPENVSKLIAEGSRAYSAKDFDSAVAKYGEACETYAEEHGDDPDLLFLYGKAVFQSAISKSEVFGGAPPARTNDDNENGEGEQDEEDDQFQFYDAEPVEAEVTDEQEEEGPQLAEEDEEDEDEEDGKGKPEKQEEEESDFEIAWEILDLTRTLLEDKLSTLDKGDLSPPYLESDRSETTNEYIITVKKLADCYDILGDISLETENFQQSATDFQECLDLKLKLYNPENSGFLSEAYYKVALALEFCSDPQSRQKAAEQLKLAIESVQRRNKHETDSEMKKENDEMIQELQVKYDELRKAPSDQLQQEQMELIKGILGQEATSSGGDTSTSMSEVLVNNLTSMVKKKKPAQPVNDLSGMVKKRKAPKPDGNGVKKSKTE